MRNVAGMALVALMLAGCAPVGAGVPAQPAEPGEDACGAAALQVQTSKLRQIMSLYRLTNLAQRPLSLHTCRARAAIGRCSKTV